MWTIIMTVLLMLPWSVQADSTVAKSAAIAEASVNSGKSEVTVRQVNPSTYEVTTRTSKGTEKKLVTVRQTVGPTYEVTVR